MNTAPIAALNIESSEFEHTVAQILQTPEMQRDCTIMSTEQSRAPSLISEGAILTMILDDIKYVKHTLETHTADEKTEFRRIADKIENLEKSLREEMQDHSTDITRLQTKMKFIAWVSGAIAGLVSSIALAVAKHFMG